MKHIGWNVIVIGAGVFGAWTAEILRRKGQTVLLVDGWGPANARASSGGESRLIRGLYGRDRIYSEMALDSLDHWMQLSNDADLPLFHQTGVLAFFDRERDEARASLEVLQQLNSAVEYIEPSALVKRWPQIDWSGVSFGLYEREFGALMARRSVLELVQSFVRGGGSYRQVMVHPPKSGEPLTKLRTSEGDDLHANAYVFACGPWLPKVFPNLLQDLMFVSRQEVFFFHPPCGNAHFSMPLLPGLVEFVGEKIYYAIPDLESRGLKIADDGHGPEVDVDLNDRMPSREVLASVRSYMAQRLPELKDAPLSETRVCQYENSWNGDFLIDRHPDWANVILVGMGSGHGFKHGPAVGKRAAALVLGNEHVEGRFSLASKRVESNRTVH